LIKLPWTEFLSIESLILRAYPKIKNFDLDALILNLLKDYSALILQQVQDERDA